jgi:hypothetical protein
MNTSKIFKKHSLVVLESSILVGDVPDFEDGWSVYSRLGSWKLGKWS